MAIEKRHFYECGGETLSWQQEWYTQAWFTSLRQSYDRAASTGAVNPPLEIIETVWRCSRLISSQSAVGGLVTSTERGSVVVGGQTVATTRTTVFGPTRTESSRSGSITSGASGPAVTSGESGVSGSSRGSVTLGGTSISSSPTTSLVSSSSIVSATAGPSALPAAFAATTNTCAGEWDWQAWGMVANLGFGLIVGSIIWLMWALLRGKMPGMYAGRTWFVPPESRPSRPWSFLGFILPFLHLPSTSSLPTLSEGHLALHSMLAALKLAAVSSLLALAVALPLFMANTPCLDATSPSNNLGGRLGGLTDMSLLRLLNSLDPSPGSVSTSNQLHLQPYIRALPSTIAPAINSARTRLIVLLVIIAVLGCGGGLFIIFRTYTAFARYRKRFKAETRGEMEMVIVPVSKAPAWKGVSEEGIKKWIGERSGRGEDKFVEIVGVFGIPDTSEWKAKVAERDVVLNKLEEAEVRYIESFRLVQTPSNGHRLEESEKVSQPAASPRRHDFIAPKDYYRLSSGRGKGTANEGLDVPIPATPAAPSTGVKDSKFREVNRDSALFGRMPIGQRVRINSMGMMSPDPSPEDEHFNPLGTPRPNASEPFDTPRSAVATPASPRNVPLPPSPENEAEDLPRFHPGPERHPELHTRGTAAAIASARPSQESSPLGQYYHDIRGHRSLFKSLNGEIGTEQQKSWGWAAKGENVTGWVIVGKGVRALPGAQHIAGSSREDIIWDHVGKPAGEGVFWVKVGAVAFIVAAIMVPFIGLTVATAPGFAHYLGFLRPLADSDGFGSGVVEGLVPAIVLSVAIGLAVFAVTRFARRTQVISRSRQRFLAFQGTFYLTLFTTLFWLVTVAALEYAVQGFASDVQASRSTGDGAVFSTWFVFVALLNVAVIAPGLYLLQPKRLIRSLLSRRKAITPRQKFRRHLPPSFNPSFALLPFLVAVFYAFSLVFLFPLLAIPILLLVFLGLVANRYMVDYVLVERVGYMGSVLGLWTIRRFGWVLGVQPALYGLILLSRREWALGGASLAVAVITVILSEILTIRRYRKDKRRLSRDDRTLIDKMAEDMAQSRDDAAYTALATSNRPRVSDASMLSRLAALLPGYSRLPSDCPLPLPTENIDDLFYTERAALARPGFARKEKEKDRDGKEYGRRFFHDPTESQRGLIYPDEILAPVPVVWLPADEAGVALSEAADLEGYHGLAAIVDPDEVKSRRRTQENESERRGSGGRDGVSRTSGAGDEVRSPLLR